MADSLLVICLGTSPAELETDAVLSTLVAAAESIDPSGSVEIRAIVIDDSDDSEESDDRWAPEMAAAAVADEIGSEAESRPIAVLLAHSIAAEDIVPRVAARISAVAITECSGLSGTPSGWEFSRPLYGGGLSGNFSYESTRVVASLVLDEFEGLATAGTVPEVRLATPENDRPHLVRVLDRIPSSDGESLETASVIVSGGRGIGGPEGFAILAKLADAIEGKPAASRPPCDSGWTPGSFQVGITGRRVRPDLYIAVAISGSIQHLAGMAKSKTIVAINSDPEAPIFRYAHIGIVGDWREVVDGMLESLDGAEPSRVAVTSRSS